MAVLIGNARIDERGKASGGAAGDSTGKEVCIQNWYSYPWDTVLIPTSKNGFAESLAIAMEYATANDHIGYDQSQRTTLHFKVKALGWKPMNLRQVGDCETDCSALIAVCVNAAAGKQVVSENIYTGNLAAALVATGLFTKSTDSKYLTTSDYCTRGMILLNTTHHVAMALSNGSKAGSTSTNSGGTVSIGTGEEWSMYDMSKTWKNGSTAEPVYADTALTTKVGELSAYESCTCIGKSNNRYIVLYKVSGSSSKYKVGFVSYSGGVK